ncbi:hypothetical protein SISNIDRAFT_464431 [Sistotremastrum niveocremeum HHB9708]|uniref:Uncharacterized protein n=1 Tax=Sistotremastrum niveocremeum HHB9708 TaxID=1314777 RepID=A0A164WV57_9AGAM|nr:hypothetical protein SISNIDRAFT_464431 [Sistotremastrum niveocremeum HHB9708]
MHVGQLLLGRGHLIFQRDADVAVAVARTGNFLPSYSPRGTASSTSILIQLTIRRGTFATRSSPVRAPGGVHDDATNYKGVLKTGAGHRAIDDILSFRWLSNALYMKSTMSLRSTSPRYTKCRHLQGFSFVDYSPLRHPFGTQTPYLLQVVAKTQCRSCRLPPGNHTAFISAFLLAEGALGALYITQFTEILSFARSLLANSAFCECSASGSGINALRTFILKRQDESDLNLLLRTIRAQ